MHPRTTATLEELNQAEWFANVGVNDTTVVNVVSSWEEALDLCSSNDWGNLCLEAANQYRNRLAERSMERFRKWNEVVIETKKVTLPFVRRKVENVVLEHQLPSKFESRVHWDILHACMEAEYADVYPPGFYSSHAYWYVRGHFPCGYCGDFPNGRLIVF